MDFTGCWVLAWGMSHHILTKPESVDNARHWESAKSFRQVEDLGSAMATSHHVGRFMPPEPPFFGTDVRRRAHHK